ncbi:MAG: undecaprenyldiphospho-muramoylpentapeptide beta-N-acetylglucosaminyltransferase [Deltaproteobacteria bacterium]|nr:undecaprenyldiphospho-muramoylpentapeptide beta-N-acetylglucosaminyltransferase [Deltaproteobacteria bacterium]
MLQRVLIAGGGTGGHLFPGIAVADELVRRFGAEVRFVGSTHGIERTAVPRAGYAVELLPMRGLRREGIAGLARAAWRIPASVVAALQLVGRFRPQLVVGVGGYASFPAVLAAFVRRVPVVLLEQNASPGAATRALAPLARRVCVSFPQTEELLGPRAVVTGNPVRGAAATAAAPGERDAAPDAGDRPARVLVFGGSAGAHRLNEVVPAALAAVGRPLEIVHQTGAVDRDMVEEAYRAQGVAGTLHAFIDDMVSQYRRADLVICRAGATTIAELTALGVAAILVPFPFAAGDHQRLNGQALVDAGAAWMILDRELSAERLAAAVRGALADPAALAATRRRALALGHPDATARVVDECVRAAGGGS